LGYDAAQSGSSLAEISEKIAAFHLLLKMQAPKKAVNRLVVNVIACVCKIYTDEVT
jgi:hypothetical protein